MSSTRRLTAVAAAASENGRMPSRVDLIDSLPTPPKSTAQGGDRQTPTLPSSSNNSSSSRNSRNRSSNLVAAEAAMEAAAQPVRTIGRASLPGRTAWRNNNNNNSKERCLAVRLQDVGQRRRPPRRHRRSSSNSSNLNRLRQRTTFACPRCLSSSKELPGSCNLSYIFRVAILAHSCTVLMSCICLYFTVGIRSKAA